MSTRSNNNNNNDSPKHDVRSKRNGNGNGTQMAGSKSPIHAFRNAQFYQQLETEIAIRRTELEALERARDVLLGAPIGPLVSAGHATFNTAPTTVSDAVEQILRANPEGPMHVSELASELASRYSMKTTPKNLMNTLNRWVQRGKKFRRTQPNTFALAETNGHHGSSHAPGHTSGQRAVG